MVGFYEEEFLMGCNMALQRSLASEIKKIDSKKAKGRDGCTGSLACMIQEIQDQFCGYTRCFGKKEMQTETRRAERFDVGVSAFSCIAGNNSWGEWVHVLGSEDLPIFEGAERFDLIGVALETMDKEAMFGMQFAFVKFGENVNEVLSVSDLLYVAPASKKESRILALDNATQDIGTNVYARCYCKDEINGQIDFYLCVREHPKR